MDDFKATYQEVEKCRHKADKEVTRLSAPVSSKRSEDYYLELGKFDALLDIMHFMDNLRAKRQK